MDLERRIGQDQIAQDSSLQNQSQVIIKRKLIFFFRCLSVCPSVCNSSFFLFYFFFSFPTLFVHCQNEVCPPLLRSSLHFVIVALFLVSGTLRGVTLVVVPYVGATWMRLHWSAEPRSFFGKCR